MNVDVKIQGIESVEKNFKALSKRYSKNVAKALVQGGELVRGEAIKSIQNTSPGDQVTRSREGGATYDHTASSPGDAPNTDTGDLVKSIQLDVQKKRVLVGSGLAYAKFLEFGTRVMAPRPWLVPALEKNRKKIKKLIASALKRTPK